MCYRPIKISNPSRHYANDMPKYLYVPCGHCADCLRNKKNEWYFRSMIEYQDVLAKKGCCLFVTLTYNNDNIPVFILPDGTECTGFNKHHIRNFIKYFRIYFSRRGIEHKGIKYLICSEYGEHTRRPHYHGLLFLPVKPPWHELQEVLKRAWHYGFVVCSKLGWYISSPSGLRYCSKYICKDMTFYSDVLHEYLSEAKTTQDRKDLLEPIKDYLPNHWQSVGYGESFIYSHILHSGEPAKVLFDNKSNLNTGDPTILKIPRYYHLKLEKQRNKAQTRALGKVVLDRSDIGIKVEVLKHKNRLENEFYLFRSLSKDSLELLFPRYEDIKDIYFKNLDKGFVYNYSLRTCSDYLEHRNKCISGMVCILQTVNVLHLAIYHAYLRFYPYRLGENVLDFFNQIEQIVDDIIYQPAVQPELNELLLDKLPYVASPLRDRDFDKYDVFRCCCEHPDLQVYEKFCQYYDFYQLCVSLQKESVAIFKEKRKNHLSTALRGNNY